MNPPFRSFRFPEGFLWGSATSAHQVEGGNSKNDWWDWEQTGRVKEKSQEASRHYEFFREDFETAKQLHHRAHRFSIEWSRIEPEPGKWDENEIRHYGEVLKALRERGLEPVVTLHHFTNPRWLSAKGGWKSEESIYHFERFVHWMARTFAREVRYWITVNEPLIYIYCGYLTGEWPPGERSAKSALQVFRNFLLAHQGAYQVIHGVYAGQGLNPPLVGWAQYYAHYVPCSFWSLPDWFATLVRRHFIGKLPIKALSRGSLLFPGLYWEKLPYRKTLDFLGVNYYTRDFVHFSKLGFPEILGEICSLAHHRDVAKRNEMGWESYPEGLYRILLSLKRFRLPILITENGTCTPQDADRWEYIRDHLIAVGRAIEKGVRVLGYLYWSLLDNFEWAHGFGPRFGLLELDYRTQTRRLRESAKRFAEVCRSNELFLPSLDEERHE